MAFDQPPNRRNLVDTVFTRGGFDLRTKGGCGLFTEAIVWELEQRESGQWWHLKKSAGQNNWHGHAVDAVLHGPTGYAIDVISSSESSSAKPNWHVDKKPDGGPRYKDRTDLQLDPFPPVGGDPTPPPEPPPQPPPVPPGPSDHERRLSHLEVRLTSLEASLAQMAAGVDTLMPKLDGLDDRLTLLEDAPGQGLPDLIAEGTTDRVFGHGHAVRLTVRKA
jgi:hypothetical protein